MKNRSMILTLGLGVLTLASMAAIPCAHAGSHFNKVMIVILENTDYDDALEQPFFSELTKKGALLSNFYAETHPSQPNYIALVSGSTQDVDSDSPVDLDGRQIGDLLEAKGLQWKVYAENYPGNCYLGNSRGKYARKHVPFLSFKEVQQDPARCARIVDASQLSKDIQGGTLPSFSLFIPNLDNDGHDTGAEYADHYMSGYFETLLQDRRFTDGMLFVVTFDESELMGANHIYTALYGNSVAAGATSDHPYTHYSLLRTIEDELGLGTLGLEDASASAITDIWK